MKLPAIGMRMIKTVVAVYICFLVAYIRQTNAFYSAISSVISLQSDVHESLTAGINRIVGTLAGGVFGILLLTMLGFTNIQEKGFWYYTIVAIVTLPLIYLVVCINKPSAVFISCVVFFSIVINRDDTSNHLQFGVSRMIETLIGIGISWAVNITPFYLKKLFSKKG